jgi:hypothetical protein
MESCQPKLNRNQFNRNIKSNELEISRKATGLMRYKAIIDYLNTEGTEAVER